MDNKDPRLWKTAKKRAKFKTHLFSFIAVNIFLWGIWFFTGMRINESFGIPWPLFVTMFWAFYLAFEYFSAYHGNKEDLAEKEYEKLKNKGK